MSRGLRHLPATVLAIIGVVLGVGAQSAVLATVLPALALATIFVPGSWLFGRTIEVAVSLAAATLGIVIAFALTPEDTTWYSGRLMLFFGSVALATYFVAIPRLLFAQPWGGYRATVGLGLITLLCVSTADSGAIFPILGLAYFVSQLVAINRVEPSRLGWNELSNRHQKWTVIGFTMTISIALFLSIAIPLTYDWGMRRFGLRYWGARTGFSTNLRLGSLDGMLQSNEAVLRVYGPRPDHLRGQVYSSYRRGSWALSRRVVVSRMTTSTESDVEIDDAVEIWSVGGRRRRYFTPLGSREIRFVGGIGRSDGTGIFYPSVGETAELIRLRLGQRDGPPLLAPTEEDLAIPEELRGELEGIARSWAPADADADAVLQAMIQRFTEDFRYSLQVRRQPRTDPVLDFLDRRTGHCEYFASAMALLARSRGIPTRLAAGYRVTEYNHLGDYYSVRERNAHAWVEAWIEGRGWTTWDPTPASGLASHMTERTPWLMASFDHAASLVRRALFWLLSNDPWALSAAGIALLTLWLFVRWLQKRRKSPTSLQQRSEQTYDDPRAMLLSLLDELERRGVSRSPSETLESLARRLEDLGNVANTGQPVAQLLRDYAAWRYGGHGDAEQVDREIAAWIESSDKR